MHKLGLVAVLLHIKFSDHFNMEKGCKFSLIKEALGRANIAAYALRGSDINDDMEQDLKNHEAELGVIYFAAL